MILPLRDNGSEQLNPIFHSKDTKQVPFTENVTEKNISIDSIDTSWMTESQLRIFDVIKKPENIYKSARQILILAGYATDYIQYYYWYKAVKDKRFKELLDKLQDGLGWMTDSQRKLFTLLRDPENRYISRRELCKKAELKYEQSRWTKAIRDPRFRKLVDQLYNRDLAMEWMTEPQKRFFEILQNSENRKLSPKKLAELANYTEATFYVAARDPRYEKILSGMGIHISHPGLSHYEVDFIKDPVERECYIQNDLWDMRKLTKEYPRHNEPSKFIVNFCKIKNNSIRKIIKRFFTEMLAFWEPLTFQGNLYLVCYFTEPMTTLYPDIRTFKKLDRNMVEQILKAIYSHDVRTSRVIGFIRNMFHYMYVNKWKDGPQTDNLFTRYDIPRNPITLPRPIPPAIKNTLDDYIESYIIPLLESDKNTPIIQPYYWDVIIVLRYTGRRFEDMAHLISDPSSDLHCLRTDLDGDPQLYVDHRIAKIKKDLVIPLAHLNNFTPHGNIVVRALERQMERVKDLPVAPDGYPYLFRRIVNHDKNNKPITDVLTGNSFSKNALTKVCETIPLLANGKPYTVTAHQFRHTVATEMIDAGVDIYAVKEFLGHSSVLMTERYIRVYQDALKKEFQKKLGKSLAQDINNDLPGQEALYDNQWVKNKIIGVFELGDGCCEHPYKIPSCPHMVCKICIKKRIYPRHLQAVKDTIESETIHRDNALRLGLVAKAEEFDKVIKFYSLAFDKISKSEIFDAAKDFYGGEINA